jgi:hypothetical protein
MARDKHPQAEETKGEKLCEWSCRSSKQNQCRLVQPYATF